MSAKDMDITSLGTQAALDALVTPASDTNVTSSPTTFVSDAVKTTNKDVYVRFLQNHHKDQYTYEPDTQKYAQTSTSVKIQVCLETEMILWVIKKRKR